MSRTQCSAAVIARIGKMPRAVAAAARIGLSEHILPTAATMVGAS